ncbi:hypothetical protein O181_088221 [Austropuccinia psidii MF-1]|uniref:Uncharacterized protein n=1 Tax=Austropuccinia psidii MF-1 TaxID=1389203 RepID=A0A9Q3IR68_9BASI|nr:hypothetical protein [Austropuccinia psidii MF-1]
MVHTRNQSNYSAQLDGCGQGRGDTKSRSIKSSSRNTHMEYSRVSPHSPRSIPTKFDVNAESGLIHDNIFRSEPLPSGRNRNLSIPIQKFVQRTQRRGAGNMPKPLAGGHELLLTHQEIYGPEEVVGKDSSFGDRRPSGIYHLQTSSRSVQRQAQRTSEEAERSQEPSRQGQRQSQLAQTLPTGVQDSQIGAFSHGQCLQYGEDSYGIQNQGEGKDEQNLSTEIIQEINLVKTSINVEIGKIYAKLTKMTLEINDLKNNDKHFSEMHKSVIAKVELLTNTCDRIESKYHVQDDEMEDFSTRNINDQLRGLKDYVLEVAENTSEFAIWQEVTVKGRN